MIDNNDSIQVNGSALKRFISSLTSEEKMLVQSYLDTPDSTTLSSSFDAIVEGNSHENKVDKN